MAGYSDTPLPKKLGIVGGKRVAIVGAPPGFTATLAPLPQEVAAPASSLGTGTFDVIITFATTRAQLERAVDMAHERLDPAGGIWVAWPKRSSGVATDITEDVVREVVLPRGLVDNKVCAIDETWSGLRCVVRLVNRKKTKATAKKTRKPARRAAPRGK